MNNLKGKSIRGGGGGETLSMPRIYACQATRKRNKKKKKCSTNTNAILERKKKDIKEKVLIKQR